MSRRVLRWVIVLVAVAALAAAAFKVWELEQEATLERDTAGTFDRQAWQLTMGLADLRAAIQAYVADGQLSESWQKTAAGLHQSVSAQAKALRDLARSPEGQGAVEGAIEGAAALAKTEARAREFLASSQRLSASDVVFSEAAPHITKIGNNIDMARGHESVASATLLGGMRVRQLIYLGSSFGIALVALLLLVSVPRSRGLEIDVGADVQPGSSLGIGHIPSSHAPAVQGGASEAPASTVSLPDTAEVCMALARVQEPRELPVLLERAAAVLHAAGIVVWMPDGPMGALRPALAHGYPPLTVTRMGTLAVDADNATAVAYRTRTSQFVPADAHGPGAVAVPLVTPDGCSGVMAAEITPGVHAESVRAAATIIAAQLATLISPIAPAGQRAEVTPDIVPVLDPDVIAGLEQLGLESGNATFFAQLVALFRANAPARLARIQEAVSGRDGATLESMAHTLKSNCAMLGATRMAAYCRDLEAMGELQAFAEAAALLPEATEEFARVARAVNALVEQPSVDAER